MAGDISPDFHQAKESPFQKSDRTHIGRNGNGSKPSSPGSPTVWQSEVRHQEHLKEDMVDDDDEIEYSSGARNDKDLTKYSYRNENPSKSKSISNSISPINAQNNSYDMDELKQPLSINCNPLGRSEEEAIISLEKALNGRTRVKDIVEKIRKETE